MSELFEDWIAREMPSGTVISDPLWWAGKIRKALKAEQDSNMLRIRELESLVRLLQKDNERPEAEQAGRGEDKCRQPMKGFYGADTYCARPKGHSGDHYQVADSYPKDRPRLAVQDGMVLVSLDDLEHLQEWYSGRNGQMTNSDECAERVVRIDKLITAAREQS